MKNFEVLNFAYELLKKLKNAGIKLEDANYITIFTEYQEMIDHGEKVTYAVSVLAEKYHVSERKVYDLIKRFQSDCKIPAV